MLRGTPESNINSNSVATSNKEANKKLKKAEKNQKKELEAMKINAMKAQDDMKKKMEENEKAHKASM